MARKRMVSPEMFTSATVAGWPAATRWTWVGLLCYLDDFGLGEDSPSLIKAAVWPRDSSYTERKVRADIDKIVESGSACRFECCGKPILHIPTWTDWQKVAHPTATRFCPCPVHSRPAHELHMRDSRTAPRNVVQENLEEGSSRAGGPSDPPPPGSDGLAAARAMVGRLNQRSSPENQATAQDVA